MLAELFIESLFNPDQRLYYITVVLTVIVSIVFHELAHGLTAVFLGDDTPRATGHLTANPMVHMGTRSLLFLAVCGIAWGRMPINPARLRGRHDQALVAAAGPLSNLLLALIALTALGLWQRAHHSLDMDETTARLMSALLIFGVTNIVLCMFNLIPAPPLDGSAILANYHRGFANLIHDPAKQGVFFLVFILFYVFSDQLFNVATNSAYHYLGWIAALGG